MRHGKKFNHLGRKTAHRKAMLANMASSLIEHKRITTTLAKAKALRVYVEPIITKSKNDTTHSRRTVFAYLQNKEVVTTLFREVAEKVATRPGGYTRIVKLGNRLGDNAEMALIELVDFNTIYNADAKVEKKSTRRRGSKAKKTDAPVAEAKVEEAVLVEEAPEAKAEEAPAKEAKADSSEEEKSAE
nr:50S ribosomal protein L17 [uncultured Pedobacter sp.]